MKSPDLSFTKIDFSKTPFLVIWELTQACDLVCRHCRASAMPERCPEELSTEEGKTLLNAIRDMGTPVVVLSGGDPLKRPDLLELIAHGKKIGLRVATIPAATESITPEILEKMKTAGLSQIAFSLDASTGALHDGFRQVPGTYRITRRAIEWAKAAGLPVQVNTAYSRYNLADADAMIELVQQLGIVFWEVFVLVPVGRGVGLEGLSADECEDLLTKLHRCAARAKFLLKVTEAPHYRRIIMQHRAAPSLHRAQDSGSAIPAQLAGGMSAARAFGEKAKGINAGKGFCFVSHTGDVYPSGFLPLSAGNIRETSLAALYRESPLFKQLRDPDQLKGRCGRCEYRDVCGGSRSRAYALTGDLLAEDPSCLYQPAVT
ncbi:MAG: TIGR04053 family radical SAM/SPASM domain-containing protein [Nitrospiria bacterium]